MGETSVDKNETVGRTSAVSFESVAWFGTPQVKLPCEMPCLVQSLTAWFQFAGNYSVTWKTSRLVTDLGWNMSACAAFSARINWLFAIRHICVQKEHSVCFGNFAGMTLRIWYERICWILTEIRRGPKSFLFQWPRAPTICTVWSHVCLHLSVHFSLDRARRGIVGSKESQLQGANQCASCPDTSR